MPRGIGVPPKGHNMAGTAVPRLLNLKTSGFQAEARKYGGTGAVRSVASCCIGVPPMGIPTWPRRPRHGYGT